MNHSETVNFIWNMANLIRDTFRRSKYPDVILPFTVLRRIDCVLAPTKQDVLDTYQRYKNQIAPEALVSHLAHICHEHRLRKRGYRWTWSRSRKRSYGMFAVEGCFISAQKS